MPVKKWLWSFSLMFYPHCLNHHVGLFERDERMSLDVYSHHVFFKKKGCFCIWAGWIDLKDDNALNLK